MADVFTPETTATTVNPIDSLVGEGKKFKTVEDLAKSKVEADSFIETLKAELAVERTEKERLRVESESRKTVEEQLKAITNNKVVPTPAPVTTVAPASGQVLTDDDLTRRVKAITEREGQEQIIRNNIEIVGAKMVETFGSEDKAKEAIVAKAKELNVSVKFLESAAGQSPSAFFSLVGVTGTPNLTPAAPRSEVNPASFGNRHTENQPASGTYEELRNKQGRLDVKKLIDARYLNESMNAAMKDPDKFLASVA